jgi:acid phosphatase type 7
VQENLYRNRVLHSTKKRRLYSAKRFNVQDVHTTIFAESLWNMKLCFGICLGLFHFVWGGNNVHPRHCGGTVRHVHIAVGHDPSTEMIVSFASLPSIYEPPIGGVLIGLSPTQLDTVYMENERARGYNLTVPSRQSNYDGTKYYSPSYHHITINELKPATTYYYKPIVHANLRSFTKYDVRVPDEFQSEHEDLEGVESFIYDDEGMNDETGQRRLTQLFPYDGTANECPSPEKIRSFRTAPAPFDPELDDPAQQYAPVSFAIVGDLGQFPHSEETFARLILSRDEIDSIILAGDIAYPNMDHQQWDTFFDFLDDYPITDRKPMQIVPGNHDIDKVELGSEIFLAYEYRFRMPRVHPPQLGLYDGPPGFLNMDVPPYPLPYEWGNAYYAYTYGPARFVMVSSYSSILPGSAQHTWIQEELAAIDRRVTPWVIVVLHTPMYNTFALHRHDLQIVAVKEHLESILVEHKVNMVFTGHIHAYLRTANVVNDGVLDPTGPVHITVGAGGRKCEAPFMNLDPEPWVKVRDATIYGYGMFRILNQTHASWDWVHTGVSEDHPVNLIHKSNATLPPGPATDRVVVENQYFL